MVLLKWAFKLFTFRQKQTTYIFTEEEERMMRCPAWKMFSGREMWNRSKLRTGRGEPGWVREGNHHGDE